LRRASSWSRIPLAVVSTMTPNWIGEKKSMIWYDFDTRVAMKHTRRDGRRRPTQSSTSVCERS
jgi:hypothetical protein